MKATILSALIFFYLSTTFSQIYFPLVEEGKVWSTYHNYCKGSTFSEFSKFEGDTLINGKSYLKVWKTGDTTLTNWTYDGKIREDGYGVYYGNANSSDEILIYTFHAGPGDSIFLRGSSIPYILDSIGMTTLLNGKPRPIYYFSCPDFSCTETWIEGIGSNYGILNGGFCGMVGDSPEMICFSEDGILKYKNPDYEYCYVITGTIDPDRNELILYPNPASGFFTIQFKDQIHKPSTLEFRDLAGKVMQTYNLQEGINPVTIQAPSSPGMYFYRLMDKDGIKASGKLLVY